MRIKKLALLEVLLKLEVKDPVLLPYSKEELREFLFAKTIIGNKEVYMIDSTISPIISKIDFSNVSFDNVCVERIDFSKYHGVHLNPQTIYEKSLRGTNLSGVTIIGANINETDLFKDVNISGTIFDETNNVKINPQTIKDRNLSQAVLKGVIFTGQSFDQARIDKADFTDSIDAHINPNKIVNSHIDFGETGLNATNLTDATLTDLPSENVCTKGTIWGNSRDKAYAEYKEIRDKIKQIVLPYQK